MLNCPFYNNGCIIKPQTDIPDFKRNHDCGSKIDKCSFFIKEKLKQIKASSQLKIIIKQVSNPYLVKADGFVYPSNTLLKIDDLVLNKMTNNELQKKCDDLYAKGVKAGFSYPVNVEKNWALKQKYFFNAIVSVESRLVNESDVNSAMKKTLLLADQMKLENLVFLPFDNGTHDIVLIAQTQLAAMYILFLKHEFKYLKSVYICMQDEESEQSFIEYYNRIFGEENGSSNRNDTSSDT